MMRPTDPLYCWRQPVPRLINLKGFEVRGDAFRAIFETLKAPGYQAGGLS